MIMLRKIKEDFFENGLKEDRENDYVTIGIIFGKAIFIYLFILNILTGFTFHR